MKRCQPTTIAVREKGGVVGHLKESLFVGCINKLKKMSGVQFRKKLCIRKPKLNSDLQQCGQNDLGAILFQKSPKIYLNMLYIFATFGLYVISQILTCSFFGQK
jgi:hypothetical protein